MPSLRGPTVGRAFVLILADGSGLPKSIKDEMEKAEPFAEQAGHRHSKAYGQAFAKELHKGNHLEKSIDEGLGRADAIEKHFSGPEWKKTVDRLQAQFGDAGVKLGHEMQEGVRRGGDINLLHDMLGNIGPEIHRVRQDIATAMEDAAKDTERGAAKVARGVKGVRGEVNKSHRPLQIFASEFDKLAKSMSEPFKKSRNDFVHAIGGIFGLLIKTPALAARVADGMLRASGAVGRFVNKSAVVRKGTENLIAGGRAVGSFVGEIGKGVGGFLKGFTVIQKVVDGLAGVGKQVFDFFTGIGKSASDVGSQVQEGLGEAGKALEGVGKSASAAGEEIAATGPAGLIAAAAAVVVALAVIPLVVGAAVSAMSLLVGAAVALAASLSFAVVGALAPLAGLLLPVAVGFATVALAMSVWKKESKETTAAVKKANTEVQNAQKAVELATPGTEAYAKATKRLALANDDLAKAQKGSGDAISASMTKLKGALGSLKAAAVEGIFGKTANSPETKQITGIIDNITAGIGKLKPLLTAVGGGIRGFFTELTKPLKGGGFQKFVDMMTANLPGQITKLGTITTNVFGIIGGLFTALQPTVDKFLGALSGSTGGLSKWINSVAGQNQLKDFFDKAWTSAQKVWDLLKQLGIDVGKILSPGKDTGDSIIDSMTKSLKDLGDWLDAHPGEIAAWFAGAKDAADAVGHVITEIVKLIDQLDTPTNRKRAGNLFDVIIAGVQAVEISFAVMEGLWNVLVAAWDIGPLMIIFSLITGGWDGVQRNALNAIHRVLLGIKGFVDTMASLPGPIGAPFRALKGPIDVAIGKIEDLQSQAAEPMKPVINIQTKNANQAKLELEAVAAAAAGIPTDVYVNVHNKFEANPRLKNGASGLMVTGPTRMLIGEAGPEAVVPLNRPLAAVDPAVRELSAFAQGLPTAANGAVAGSGKVVNVGGLTVITPTQNPFAVASEVVNHLVGSSLI